MGFFWGGGPVFHPYSERSPLSVHPYAPRLTGRMENWKCIDMKNGGFEHVHSRTHSSSPQSPSCRPILILNVWTSPLTLHPSHPKNFIFLVPFSGLWLNHLENRRESDRGKIQTSLWNSYSDRLHDGVLGRLRERMGRRKESSGSQGLKEVSKVDWGGRPWSRIKVRGEDGKGEGISTRCGGLCIHKSCE